MVFLLSPACLLVCFSEAVGDNHGTSVGEHGPSRVDRGMLPQINATFTGRKNCGSAVRQTILLTLLRSTSMPRDTRTRRDLHALDAEGMVLCNPRDREAAHRAEVEGIATDDPSAVTCPACIALLHQQARDRRSRERSGASADVDQESRDSGPAQPGVFVRIRDAATMIGSVREGDGVDPRLERLQRGRSGGRRKPDYGAERLAHQIRDCLQFSSVLSDVGLEQFAFVGVVPGQRNGQFMIEVAPLDPAAAYDPQQVEQMLDSCRGRVRAEVAAGVHRRKAPDIAFRVRRPHAGS